MKRIRIDKSKVRLERVLPEILPIDPRDPDVPSSQGAHGRRGSVLILSRVWAG